jgi:hypothetical protein
MSELTLEALDLSPEELALIKAKRDEEAAKAEREAAEEAARVAKIEEAKKRHERAVISMIDKLDSADDDGITYQTKEGGPLKVFFLLDGREYQILVEEHRVCSPGSWRAHSKGLKYKLDNEYNNRYLVNPKTVIKKIKELQEAAAAKAAREMASKDLSERALEALKRKYPNADVAFQKGFDYRGSRNRNWRNNYQPDHITVTTPNGTVEFTYSNDTPTPGVNEEGVKFSIRARRPSKEIGDQITKLILG